MTTSGASTSTTREFTCEMRHYLEEFLWLRGGGVSEQDAADRIGLHLNTVKRYFAFAADAHVAPFDTYTFSVG